MMSLPYLTLQIKIRRDYGAAGVKRLFKKMHFCFPKKVGLQRLILITTIISINMDSVSLYTLKVKVTPGLS